MSQENLQTMITQNFGGGKRGVLWDCASSEFESFRSENENEDDLKCLFIVRLRSCP